MKDRFAGAYSTPPSWAKAIAAHPGDTEAALTSYEETPFPRSESAAAKAHPILELCVGDRAPFGMLGLFTGAAAEAAL
ncbi:hypothetical protein ACWCPS_16145 [Streptomyces mauvecolor]